MRIDSNTVIFITGSGSGFGLETAYKFYALGCKLVLADISLTQEAREFIAKADSSRILVLDKFDVTDEECIVRDVQQAVHHFKRIDVLLNSAGVVSMGYTVTKNGETIENDEIWRLLKINVVGTVNVSKYVAKHMIDTADKSERVIINVASVAGIEASRGMMAYGMSKGAIIGITLPMARDLGRYNIRVVTVAPQVFLTPMGRTNPSHGSKIMIENTPLGRLGDPPEFADAVQSIVEASYLTGVVFRLDGGVRTPHL